MSIYLTKLAAQAIGGDYFRYNTDFLKKDAAGKRNGFLTTVILLERGNAHQAHARALDVKTHDYFMILFHNFSGFKY